MLAENLILLRNMKGMSQEQIAEVIGISRQSYAKWEQGETVPDIEKCDRLASFYGIKLDALMHYDEKVKSTSFFFFQAEDGIRGRATCLEFRRVLFRSRCSFYIFSTVK